MKSIALVFLLMCLKSLAVQAGTLDDVRSSGVLQCGVDGSVPGYSATQRDGVWHGLSVDFCRALAATVIGDARKVNFTLLKPEERIEALQSGEIDVLVSAIPISSDIEAKNGLLFVDPFFFNNAESAIESFAPLVRQADDQWFLAVQWLRHALIMADDITAAGKDPVPALAPLDATQGYVEGGVGRALAEGGYQALINKNFAAAPPSRFNATLRAGGWLWVPHR